MRQGRARTMAHMTTLAEEQRELKTRLEGKRAPEQVALMHRAVDELRVSKAVERALKVGDRAPDFTLPNAEQRAVSSTDCRDSDWWLGVDPRLDRSKSQLGQRA